MDPIAEDFPFYTSYNYAGNKPVTKVDMEGLQEEGAQAGPPSVGLDGASPEFNDFATSILGSFEPDSISGYSIVHNIDQSGNETGSIEVLDLEGLIAGGAEFPLGESNDMGPWDGNYGPSSSTAPADNNLPQVNYDLDYFTKLPDGGYAEPDYSEQPTDSFDWMQALSDAWNSELARSIVPDYYSASATFQTSSVVMMNEEFTFYLVLRGKDPGFYFNTSTNFGLHSSVGADVGISSGHGYYNGDPTEFDSSMLSGWQGAVQIGTGVKEILGGSVSLGIERGYDSEFNVITTHYKKNFSVGVGVSTPFIQGGATMGHATKPFSLYRF